MIVSQVCRQCLDTWPGKWHDEPRPIRTLVEIAWRPLMPRPFGSAVLLSEQDRQQLHSLVRARSTPQALAFRCRLILRAAAADRPNNQRIAADLDCDRHTVGLWRERF